MSECPLRKNFEAGLESAQALSKILRKLHRSLHLCRRCASRDECPLRVQFLLSIDQAVAEVTEEWGLRVGL